MNRPRPYAYVLSLYAEFMLIYDIGVRPESSAFAFIFTSNPVYMDFFETLCRCTVPSILRELLVSIAPTYDARRTNCLFVTILAGFSFRHGYGRLLSALIPWQAHDLIASRPSNVAPDTICRDFYASTVIAIGAMNHNITNFLGGPFQDDNDIHVHIFQNWLQVHFTKCFNPTVGRKLTQRTSYVPVSGIPIQSQDEASINPYCLLSGFSPANAHALTAALKDISQMSSETENGPTL